MSQYGAYGYALNGASYRDILGHYYTGTAIGTGRTRASACACCCSRCAARRPSPARRAPGRGRCRRARSTTCARRGSSVQLRNARGRKLGTYRALRVTGRGGKVMLRGTAANGRRNGVYRGAMDFSAGLVQRRQRGQLAPARHLRARRGGRRVAALVAARGAQGAGRGGAHLRAHDDEADRELRRLPRHALAGLRRHRGGGGLDRRGRGRDERRGRDLQRASPSSPTSSPPRAGAPRTSRTRRSATSRGRGSSRSTTPTTPCRRATAGARSSCPSRRRGASSAAW